MNIQIVDSGRAPGVQMMRTLFEMGVNNTPPLSRVNLEELTRDGQFAGYIAPETDAMWIGFAIGLRIAVRFMEAGKGGDLRKMEVD